MHDDDATKAAAERVLKAGDDSCYWMSVQAIMDGHILAHSVLASTPIAAGLSDEEYGRAWAKMMGQEVKPAQYATGKFDFYGLPNVVNEVYPDQCFATESEAYVALGRAVREIHKQVPPLVTPIAAETVEEFRREAEYIIGYCEDGCMALPSGPCEFENRCIKFVESVLAARSVVDSRVWERR